MGDENRAYVCCLRCNRQGVGRDYFQSGTSEARPEGELLRIRCLYRKQTLERSAASVIVGLQRTFAALAQTFQKGPFLNVHKPGFLEQP
jgi:hypothetical protein